jgi:hypothetical protein
VDVHVRRLRAKLGAEHESLIGTVRNVGYRFVPLKTGEDRRSVARDAGPAATGPRAATRPPATTEPTAATGPSASTEPTVGHDQPPGGDDQFAGGDDQFAGGKADGLVPGNAGRG